MLRACGHGERRMEESMIKELATVRARLDEGEALEHVLQSTGKTPESWKSNEEELLAILGEDLETGRTDRMLVFQEAYAGRRALGSAPSNGRELAHTPRAEGGVQTDAPAEVEDTLRQATPQPVLASFQKQMPPAALSDPAAVDETAMIASPLPKTPWPFQESPGTVTAPLPRTSAALTEKPSTGTKELRIPERGAPASTPFGEKSRRTRVLGKDPVPQPAIPFAGSKPAPAPQKREPVVQSDMTLPPSKEAMNQPAIPFVAEDTLMPLERYAEITAILTKEGNPNATFKRLGIDPGDWLSTVRSYSKRFAKDPSLEAQFNALLKKLPR